MASFFLKKFAGNRGSPSFAQGYGGQAAAKTDEFRDCASDVGQRIFLSVTVLLLFSVTAETNPGGMLNISRWCKPPVIPGDKIVPSPGRGVINQSRYVIDTPESALSRRFRNEKS